MPSPILLHSGFASTEGRELKARKIEAVIADFMGKCEIAAWHILDIGCGRGHIAVYFAHRNRVTACGAITVPICRIESGERPRTERLSGN